LRAGFSGEDGLTQEPERTALAGVQDCSLEDLSVLFDLEAKEEDRLLFYQAADSQAQSQREIAALLGVAWKYSFGTPWLALAFVRERVAEFGADNSNFRRNVLRGTLFSTRRDEESGEELIMVNPAGESLAAEAVARILGDSDPDECDSTLVTPT